MPFLRRGFLKSANRPNYLYCRIDPSGVAAVFFAFLFLFIGQGTAPNAYRPVSVDMATALHARDVPAALREDAIIIAITRDGTLYFRETRIAMSDLESQIHNAVNEGSLRTIFLKADARAKYGDVSAVAGAISASGFEHIVLLVESPRSSAT